MIKFIVFDFSRVLLMPNNQSYGGGLNDLHGQLKNSQGYNLSEYFYLNNELLEEAKKLKERFSLYIFTTGSLQNEEGIKEPLDEIFIDKFTVRDIGFQKHDPKAYVEMAGKISAEPEEILFIDDTPENIEAAKTAGLQTIQYKSNQQIISDFRKVLNL